MIKIENIEKIIETCDKYEDETIDLRRKIHENPELSNEEYETSQMVENYLLDLGIEVQRLGETGIVGTIHGKAKGKVLLLRADMDALPIQEKTDLSFKSKKNGIMHACGHDVHTSNLLIVSKILNELKDNWIGTVKVLFQPAEEKGGGGRDMIELGVLENPKVDMAMALHVTPVKSGEIVVERGNITAFSDAFDIIVKGKKAHTMKAEEGIDAINIASHIVVALNSIIIKNINSFDSATFSIGIINGGTAANIVSDRVDLRGMMRSLNSRSRDIMKKRIKEISKGTAEMFGGESEIIFTEGYPSVFNNKSMANDISKVFIKNSQELYKDLFIDHPEEYILTEIDPVMASEDFGFFAQKIPSLYYLVGTGGGKSAHSSEFYVEEKWIKLCTRSMVVGAINFLSEY
nr:M20 family metallopeptidase [Tissierella sp.]